MEKELNIIFERLKNSGKLPNLTDKVSQRLNENFEKEFEIMYKELGVQAIESINSRKALKNFGELYLYINFNSYSFFRDGNYSLSLLNKLNEETTIISFFPVENKTLRIVQIQGQKGFEVGDKLLKDWKQILIDELKIFAHSLGFKKLEILRAEENYLFVFPRYVPDNFNLKEHQERMVYIYNVLPVRKWGFKYSKGGFYSTFEF